MRFSVKYFLRRKIQDPFLVILVFPSKIFQWACCWGSLEHPRCKLVLNSFSVFFHLGLWVSDLRIWGKFLWHSFFFPLSILHDSFIILFFLYFLLLCLIFLFPLFIIKAFFLPIPHHLSISSLCMFPLFSSSKWSYIKQLRFKIAKELIKINSTNTYCFSRTDCSALWNCQGTIMMEMKIQKSPPLVLVNRGNRGHAHVTTPKGERCCDKYKVLREMREEDFFSS